MKLEAEDIKHSRKLYAATVGDVIDNRVLVTLDGLDAQSNYWADVDSPYLHPVNWHAENGYSIQAPAGMQQQTSSMCRLLQRPTIFVHCRLGHSL